MRKKIGIATLVAAGLIGFAGCTNYQIASFEKKKEPREILAGRTPKSDIESWYGAPLRKVPVPGGGEIYVYRNLDIDKNVCEELTVTFLDDGTVGTFSYQ